MSAIQKHIQWIRQMQDQGWSHGENFSADAKKHPCMKPWEHLSHAEQTEFIANGHQHQSSASIEMPIVEDPPKQEAEHDGIQDPPANEAGEPLADPQSEVDHEQN